MRAPSVPPVVVFDTDEGLRLVDGYHRAEAARRAGRKTIEAEVRAGSWREAMRYAAQVSRRPRAQPDEEMLQEREQARENVKRFRAGVGLPTDDAVLDWFMTQWDIGLTIYETDEELERIAPFAAAVEAARGRVRVYAKDHAGTWAGTWQIREHGAPILCVAFTGDLASHRKALELPRVEVRPATRTMAQLEAIVDTIDFDEFDAVGIELTRWGIDVEGNVVNVSANGDDEQSARELFAARYGDAVRISWGEKAEDLV